MSARLAPLRRLRLQKSLSSWNNTSNFSRNISAATEIELKPAKETEDVHVLDRLLSTVRQRSDPAFRS